MKSQSAQDALQTLMTQPNANEAATRLAEEILKQFATDDEMLLRKGRNVIRAFLENPDAADAMLISFCGWSMKSLLIFANLIPDDEGLLN